MEIHERIKGLREDHDQKQETIAKLLRITRQQYSLYETGQRQFKLEHIQALCIYYKVTADYILGLPRGLDWPRR